MTRLLLVFDNANFITLEVDEAASNLRNHINQGKWQVPEEVTRMVRNADDLSFRAVALRGWVFAIVDAPLRHNSSLTGRVTLSPRQRQILLLLSNGLTNKQISRQLEISARMVSMHITNIRKKMGTQTIAESVSKGTSLGYLQAPKRRGRP